MAIIIKKTLFILFMCVVIMMVFFGCDSGLKIVNVEIGQLPTRIVYVAHIDTELDLSGCTLIETTKQGDKNEWSISNDNSIVINHSIDFTQTGVYEVEIIYDNEIFHNKLLYKFLIQVIDDKIYNQLKED